MTRRSIDREELAQFREALRNSRVQRMQHDRADTGRRSGPDRSTVRARREAATQSDSASLTSRTSDGRVEPVAPSQSLSFALADLPERTLARLRRGEIAWQAGLDLHGYDLDQARLEFEHFMQDMRHEQARCVLIVHGKAWSGVSRYPVIKSHLNAWLRELPEVLAFCSARDADGGTGAVYVLLRRQRDRA
ncbi:DNA-nicking Smr family endonuclease [Kushneria sinocarnis]|uniref:DNA-nicking Smr family endonuclease n=1 Tax=Kushneria sinocarnis TaxID=595502 RepID=A0A420WUX2_9GAMM|nr:Smr/MutS family protein [Kushneria sinocarnis]RKQ97222.1 DNA-nicking Smr family endonuclease [Kushneria sinocarnis]